MRCPLRAVLIATLVPTVSALAAPAPSAFSRPQALVEYRAGQAAFEGENLGEAEQRFLTAVRLDPSLLIAHYALGQTYMRARRYEDAVRAFAAARRAVLDLVVRRVTDRASVDASIDDEIRELRESVRLIQSGTVKLAQAQTTLTRLENRIDELQRLKGKSADGPIEMPAEISLALGSAQLRAGQLNAAAQSYAEALRARPTFGEAHNNLAVVYMARSEWEAAEREVALARQAGFPVAAQLAADLAARRAPEGLGAPTPVPASTRLNVAHTPVSCVTAGTFPVLTATVTPAGRVGRVRVKFRSAGAKDWYSVTMRAEPDGFVALLPRARPALDRFTYLVEASDVDLATVATEEFSPRVVPAGGTCSTQWASAPGQAVVVDGPPDADPVPPGFDKARTAAPGAEQKIGALPNLSRKGHIIAATAVTGAAIAGALVAASGSPVGGTIEPPKGGLDVVILSAPPAGSAVSLSAPFAMTLTVGVRAGFTNGTADVTIAFLGGPAGCQPTLRVTQVPVRDRGATFTLAGPFDNASGCTAFASPGFSIKFLERGSGSASDLAARNGPVPLSLLFVP
jgi:tetratricopeptide (TPR) repeat protein